IRNKYLLKSLTFNIDITTTLYEMQQYFATPKYDKKPIYKNPAMQYHYFTNAFGYYRMIKAENPLYPKKKSMYRSYRSMETSSTLIHETQSIFMAFITIVVDETVSKNAAVQKRSFIKKENAEKLIELQEIYEHYCLALVKGVKQFVVIFPYNFVVISQDNKAKVLLGIPAVSKTFQTIQTINKTVTLADHDFPIRTHQKLISFVYLAIDPLDSNDTLRKGQLFVPNITSAPVKPIWVLLVNRGPDENPRYLKNILRYIRMHAPGQSAYNPVEQAMCTLSGKLASITLPIDTFVTNQELANKNFRYAEETLCTLWSKDMIFRKNVMTQYVDDTLSPFQIENNEEDLDIRKCDDLTCCHLKRNEESAAFLAENNRFLPLVSKGRDGHFLNPVHILQYADLLKLLAYDAHCLSIPPEMYHCLCCTVCRKYFPTLKMITTHKKSEHMKQKKHKERKHTILSNSLDDFSLNLTSATPEISYCGSISDNE
ncbi:35560_t:CDS:2, partial [Gigaspora margarita]